MAAGGPAGNGGAAFVDVQGLGRRYGDAWAVRGLAFQVRRGEILGIIGPNGAGKTTALKMLAGLLAPSEGGARVGGLAIDAAEHRAQTGYLPEESPLYDELSPQGYLRFFGDLYGVPRGVASERSEAALRLLQLDARPGQKLGDLSKGNRRKVAIARTLVNDPALLLYDEPASGLDPVASASILELLRTMRAQGKALILSAHNLYHMERVCDRVLILRQGSVAALGTMAEIRAAAGGTEYVVLLSVALPGAAPVEEGWELVVPSLDDVPALEKRAQAAGGRMLGVEPRALSLEDIFLKRVAR
ncbi:MAG TPA: ABC transporter ATP-binding protein [Candidatus Thermoplasmatota archaeon]|jgi:ABC-2 type transport system ATP-binding protein|nr:ABC transporter ATP-binding protein [Candidatus Thermoplasmatota archaeon]